MLHELIEINSHTFRVQPGLNKLNLLDKREVSNVLNSAKPDIIIHCAAERFPDKVESDPQTAYDLNVGATAHLAHEASKYLLVNSPFV